MEEHHLVVRRTARYFTLGAVSDRLRDVWIVCHGYGQLGSEFLARFVPIESPSRLIVAPEGLSRFYLDRQVGIRPPPARVGATWMTREDRDHEIADQVAYLDDLSDAIKARVAARGPAGEASRVRLRAVGFSQGVATVGRWMGRGRTRVDELILWAGSFPPDVDLTSLAARLTGASIVLVTGSRDELSSWADAEGQRDRFREAGIPARLVTFDGGHRLDDATLASIADASETAPLQAHLGAAGTGTETR